MNISFESIMGLDFDIREFLNHIRATKPPYECPAKDCGKIYKSFAGIQFHLFNFNHAELSGGRPGSASGSQSPQRALTYAEAKRIVELEMDGKLQRISIVDTIPFAPKEDFESEVVPCKAEEPQPEPPSQTSSIKTPKNSKHLLKKMSKTPSQVKICMFCVL